MIFDMFLLILKYSGEQQSNQDHFLRLILSSQSTKKHDNHQVTIAVPDVGDNANGQLHHHLVGEKPRSEFLFRSVYILGKGWSINDSPGFRVLLRKPPLKKSKVPLKYQVTPAMSDTTASSGFISTFLKPNWTVV